MRVSGFEHYNMKFHIAYCMFLDILCVFLSCVCCIEILYMMCFLMGFVNLLFLFAHTLYEHPPMERVHYKCNKFKYCYFLIFQMQVSDRRKTISVLFHTILCSSSTAATCIFSPGSWERLKECCWPNVKRNDTIL